MPEEPVVSTPAPEPEAQPLPDDFTQFVAARRAQEQGEKPPEAEKKPSETPVEPPVQGSEPAVKTDSASDAEGEEEQDEEGEGEGKVAAGEETPEPKRRGGARRKIDKLTRKVNELDGENRVLREKLEGLEAASKPAEVRTTTSPGSSTDPEPVVDDQKYKDLDDPYAEWVKDWNRWDRRQDAAKEAKESRERTAKAAYQGLQAKWKDRLDAFKKDHDDYDEVMDMGSDVTFEPHVQHAIFVVDEGPAVAYHLGTHREDLERIAGLDPISAVLEIGRLSARISKPVLEKKSPAPALTPPKVSSAPRPVSPVNTGGSPPSPSVMDEAVAADYTKWRDLRRAQMER